MHALRMAGVDEIELQHIQQQLPYHDKLLELSDLKNLKTNIKIIVRNEHRHEPV